jgi:hypothetical protein
MSIWIFTLYGAGIGALSGGITGAIANLRSKGPAHEEADRQKKSADAAQPENNKNGKQSDEGKTVPSSKVVPSSSQSRPHPPNVPLKHLDAQPTLYSLFKHDFDSTVRISGPFTVKEKDTNKTIAEFDAQIYMDFPARSKFIGVYFPRTTPDETVKQCELFADYLQGILGMQMPEATSAFVGEEMMSSKDLIFSGRVFIYHEDSLSLEQRASLEVLYKSKNLSVQFRGPDYLAGRILAWSASRRP